MIRLLLAAALALLACIFTLNPQTARAQSATDPSAESTILVFDVSNSMWGQIDGTAKIEIARDVIGDLLNDWNPDVNLGLVAYGHRRAGDCSDIEQVIPIGPVDPDSFTKIVKSLVPRGKTPLTDAVRMAAEILNFRDTRATVILVSDGIESCGADPCALARELEKGGIDFTAHVIGFDVSQIEDQRQLSCLADETGGQYLTANNASELLSALQTVAAPPPPPPMLRLVAATSENGPLLSNAAIRWTVVNLATETSLLSDQAMSAPVLEASAGRYLARAEFDGGVGSVEFDYSAEEDALIRVVIEYAPLATLEGPSEVVAGSEFEVIWTGSDLQADFIAIVTNDAREGEAGNYQYTRRGSPAEMHAPDQPGNYELRYVAAVNRKTIARMAITVIPASATLEAAPVVQAGGRFLVTWVGPDNRNDFVTIVPIGAPTGTFENYTYTRHGQPMKMRAPDAPGAYELRYLTGQSKLTLATLPITVADVSATLQAAPTASAGSSLEVGWTGPDNQNDFITIVPVGAKEGTYANNTYTRKGDPLELRIPDEPGAYELRYIAAQSRTTLGSLPITVTAVSATLEAVPAIAAGAVVTVMWQGPDNENDYITIVPVGTKEGQFANYTYTRKGAPLELRVPDEPGAYELRYMLDQSSTTLGSLPITVTAVSATLEAVPAIAAGAVVTVMWQGPDNENDYITIVPVGTKEGQFANYTYTRKGAPLELRVPDEPGAYELRYMLDQSSTTLARLPITVN